MDTRSAGVGAKAEDNQPRRQHQGFHDHSPTPGAPPATSGAVTTFPASLSPSLPSKPAKPESNLVIESVPAPAESALPASTPVTSERRRTPPCLQACKRGNAMHFSLTFLDTLVVTSLIPALPSLASTLTSVAENAPLLVGLIAASLFLGRLGGALCGRFGCRPSHAHGQSRDPPSNEDGVSPPSFRAVLATVLLYSLVWLVQGLVNSLSVYVVGQFFVGVHLGNHAVGLEDGGGHPLPLFLGAIVGFLLSGLFDAQHTLDPCREGDGACVRWAGNAPMAPVGVAVLALSVGTGVLALLASQCVERGRAGGREGGREEGEDGDYQRLSGGSLSVPQAALGRQRSETELLAALEEAEEGGLPHHLHVLRIPPRYVRGCNGDRVEAARRWKETLAWRAAEGVDTILREPQRNFALIKECYPHFLHRRDRGGRPVYYELLGHINLKKLKARGVTLDEVVRYYIFLTEYIWNKLQPEDDERGAMVSILDVAHVGIMDLRGDALEFLKAASRVVQQHYVERSYKMFILNAPAWFSVLWKVIAPLLHENTRRKINILGKDHAPVLEVIAPHHLPVAYGGNDPLALGEAPEEVDFRAYVQRVNSGLEGRAEAEEVGVGGEKAGSLPTGSSGTGNRERKVGGRRAEVDDGGEPERGGDELGPGVWREGLLGVGERAMARVAGGLQALRPAFLTPLSAAQRANLGRENRFVYDEHRRQWVLIEEEEEEEEEEERWEREHRPHGRGRGAEDMEEERLVRAIQAAHEMGGRSSSISGRLAAVLRGEEGGREGEEAEATAAAAAQARTVEDLEGERQGGESKGGREAGRKERGRVESPGEEKNRTWPGSVFLVLLVAWRAMALSLLWVVPLWLLDTWDTAAHEVALLFFLGAIVAVGLWAVHATCPLVSVYAACIATLVGLSLASLLLGPLGGSSDGSGRWVGLSGEGRETAGEALSVIMAALSLLTTAGSFSWAVHVSRALFDKEASEARRDLIPSLLLADAVGVILGPVIFSTARASEQETSHPLGGRAMWFSIVGFAGLASVGMIVWPARPLLAPLTSTGGR